MSGSELLPIETPNNMFGLYLYPAAKNFMEKQQDITWSAHEIKVEKDVQDFHVNMSEDELDLVKFTLQLFVELEQSVGDIWGEIAEWFPHSEIEGAATEIERMEKSIHAFFYQKMSDVLNIDPEETLKNQEEIKVLREKLNMIGSIIRNAKEDKQLALATLTFIEQALLFSNFAMLKSFKSNGNNLISNTITGVSYVINDEVLHGVFAAYLYNTRLEEIRHSDMDYDYDGHKESVLEVARNIVAHEDAVIDYLFKDRSRSINGLTALQLKRFVRSRINFALKEINMEPIYEKKHNPISTWFYRDANSIKMHDFFYSGTNSYRRGWSFDGFSRLPYMNEGDLSV